GRRDPALARGRDERGSEPGRDARGRPLSYATIRTIETARSAPIVILNARSRRELRSTRWSVAPNASHTKRPASAGRKNRPPSKTDGATGLQAPALRNVPAALALTSQDFGLTH